MLDRLSGPEMVVPYIGTWIETLFAERFDRCHYVVPYIGTWIETVLF